MAGVSTQCPASPRGEEFKLRQEIEALANERQSLREDVGYYATISTALVWMNQNCSSMIGKLQTQVAQLTQANNAQCADIKRLVDEQDSLVAENSFLTKENEDLLPVKRDAGQLRQQKEQLKKKFEKERKKNQRNAQRRPVTSDHPQFMGMPMPFIFVFVLFAFLVLCILGWIIFVDKELIEKITEKENLYANLQLSYIGAQTDLAGAEIDLNKVNNMYVELQRLRQNDNLSNRQLIKNLGLRIQKYRHKIEATMIENARLTKKVEEQRGEIKEEKRIKNLLLIEINSLQVKLSNTEEEKVKMRNTIDQLKEDLEKNHFMKTLITGVLTIVFALFIYPLLNSFKSG